MPCFRYPSARFVNTSSLSLVDLWVFMTVPAQCSVTGAIMYSSCWSVCVSVCASQSTVSMLAWKVFYSSVAPYHGTTAVPFLYGTGTVAFTVLFSTAIPQVPRFFDTVLVRYWHTVTKTALYFDWNCNLQLVFCRSSLNFTSFTYAFYVVLFHSACIPNEWNDVTTSVAGV